MRERGSGRWARFALVAAAAAALAALTGMLAQRVPAVAGPDITERGKPGLPPSRRAVAVGHETTDMDAGGAAKIIVAWIALVLLVVAGLVFFLAASIRRDAATAPPATAQTAASIVPPGPRLQADPPHDIAELRAREAAVLTRYARLPGDPAHVQVPIDRAMARVVGRSLDDAP